MEYVFSFADIVECPAVWKLNICTALQNTKLKSNTQPARRYKFNTCNDSEYPAWAKYPAGWELGIKDELNEYPASFEYAANLE